MIRSLFALACFIGSMVSLGRGPWYLAPGLGLLGCVFIAVERGVVLCRRGDHAPRSRSYRGYSKETAGYYRAVAVSIAGEIVECKRCGKLLERTEKRLHGIADLTLDGDMMETLDRERWVEI